ncbi:hypothetical protein NPN23_23975, partial [Vibrio parahaemolyticus]|nr:hypothetical protein [Vibrio parahaemolyticus]
GFLNRASLDSIYDDTRQTKENRPTTKILKKDKNTNNITRHNRKKIKKKTRMSNTRIVSFKSKRIRAIKGS